VSAGELTLLAVVDAKIGVGDVSFI
jgi:hypothetical protein